MTVEFPEDLLPLPGSITGTERMLADKNTVTINDVKEFVLPDGPYYGAELPALEFESMFEDQISTQDIDWIGGTITKVGPVVTISGILSFRFLDVGQEVGSIICNISNYDIPKPRPMAEGYVVPGCFGLFGETRNIDIVYGKMTVVGPTSIIMLRFFLESGTTMKYESSFLFSYLTNE